MTDIPVHVEITVPSGSQLVQGNCPTCESSFGVLQQITGEKFPMFCPFCCRRADYVRVEVRA